MTMKNKGLGRIPKSLSWIDNLDEKITQEQTVTPISEIKTPSKETNIETAKFEIKQPEKSTQVGLPAGWIRATFIVNKELNEHIKAIAYWDRLTVKEVVHEALSQYMHGKNIKPIPKKKNILI